MKAFRDWSGARIGLLAGVWVIGFPLVSGLLMTLQARRDLRAYAMRSGTSLPPQMSDIYVVVAWRELIVLAVCLVVPPLVLFLAWRWARARGNGHPDAPT